MSVFPRRPAISRPVPHTAVLLLQDEDEDDEAVDARGGRGGRDGPHKPTTAAAAAAAARRDEEHALLSRDLNRCVDLSMLVATKTAVWSKRHSGAFVLVLMNSIPGYACWCFEEEEAPPKEKEKVLSRPPICTSSRPYLIHLAAQGEGEGQTQSSRRGGRGGRGGCGSGGSGGGT